LGVIEGISLTVRQSDSPVPVALKFTGNFTLSRILPVSMLVFFTEVKLQGKLLVKLTLTPALFTVHKFKLKVDIALLVAAI
jgi:hypothetical protein